MSSKRKLIFINDGYYHVFNRGVEKRQTFISKKEFLRALELLYFYQFSSIPVRFSYFKQLNRDRQEDILKVMVDSGKIVDIISYCLMPNHFHILVKQKNKNGIPIFVSNFTNAYTKYFNTKNARIGPLFQGIFKAVFIESDEQLLHLTRYIHLNPVVASIIEVGDLKDYPWSSYPVYISSLKDNIVNELEVKDVLKLVNDYKSFLIDQTSYAKKLDMIKHLVLE